MTRPDMRPLPACPPAHTMELRLKLESQDGKHRHFERAGRLFLIVTSDPETMSTRTGVQGNQ